MITSTKQVISPEEALMARDELTVRVLGGSRPEGWQKQLDDLNAVICLGHETYHCET